MISLAKNHLKGMLLNRQIKTRGTLHSYKELNGFYSCLIFTCFLFILFTKITVYDINVDIPGKLIFYRYLPCEFTNYTVRRIDEYLENTTRIDKFKLHMKSRFILNSKPMESSFTYHFLTDYIIANDVYVSGYAIFGRDSMFISLPGQDLSPEVLPPLVVKDVDVAIALSHHPITWSSPFYNFLFIILAMPQEIIDKATIIIPSTSKPLFDELFMSIFGNNEILRLDENEYAYVKEFHTIVNPTCGISHYATGAYNMSKLIKDRFNLNNNIPSTYALSNRKKGLARSVKNWKSLVKSVRLNYPQYNWKEIDDDISNFTVNAKEWSYVKVILTATGSNLILSIFMHENTGVCCLSGRRFDWEVVSLCQVFNIYLYYVPILFMTHYGKSQTRVYIPKVINALGETIYAVEHNGWSGKVISENKKLKREFIKLPQKATLDLEYCSPNQTIGF